MPHTPNSLATMNVGGSKLVSPVCERGHFFLRNFGSTRKKPKEDSDKAYMNVPLLEGDRSGVHFVLGN